MAENTTTTLSGLLKRVYGDNVTRLLPDNSIFQKMIPFSSGVKKIGEKFVQPVALQLEHGFTFAGPGAGAFAINDPIPGAVRHAEVDSYQILGQSHIDFEIASKALEANSKASFEGAMDHVMENLMVSFRHRLETQMIYGGVELAKVGSISGSTITVNAADWASGVWAGMVGAPVDVYVGSTNTLRISTTISATSLKDRKITLTTATGVAADDTIYWKGTKGNSPIGIHKILTTSGSLFGIDNSVYDLWQGNSFNVGGVLTHDKLDEAATLAQDKGFSGEMTLIVSPLVWHKLMTEQAAKRQYTESGTTFSQGASDLVFHSGTGRIKVVSSTLVKNGNGYIINKADFKRIGTVDVKLGDPLDEDNVVVRLPSNAGYQVIAYSNQALFCERPGFSTVLTGITLS